MLRPKMTNSAVERFSFMPEDRAKAQAVLWDGEVKGFGMRYSAKSGTRTYFVQYRVKGLEERTDHKHRAPRRPVAR